MRVLSALYSVLTLSLIGEKSNAYQSAAASTSKQPLPLVWGYGKVR